MPVITVRWIYKRGTSRLYFKCVTVLSLPLLLFIKQISDRHLSIPKGVQHYADSVNDKEKHDPCSQEAYNFSEQTK